MNRQIILTTILSGGIGFALAVILLPREPSASANSPADHSTESATSATTPARPTALLRRHERQSPEARTEAETTIASILRRKEARLEEIHKRSRGFLTLEDKQEIESIEQQLLQELKDRLSPEEYIHYQGQLYKDTEVGRKLTRIAGANEAELAAVAEYQRTQDGLDPKADNDLKYQEMKAELAAKFGEERASLLLSMRDTEYSETYAFTQRFGLEPSIATDILRIRNESGLALVKAHQGLRASREGLDEYENKTRQIREQTHKHFNELVGEDAAKVFIRDAEHAIWLR